MKLKYLEGKWWTPIKLCQNQKKIIICIRSIFVVPIPLDKQPSFNHIKSKQYQNKTKLN